MKEKNNQPMHQDKNTPESFDLTSLLKAGRTIWGHDRLSLPEIVIRLGKGFGDLCAIAREQRGELSENAKRELQKELGNVIFSTIRWCDDLGFSPEACVGAAIDAQVRFAASGKPR